MTLAAFFGLGRIVKPAGKIFSSEPFLESSLRRFSRREKVKDGHRALYNYTIEKIVYGKRMPGISNVETERRNDHVEGH
jgi:hypothetical protein